MRVQTPSPNDYSTTRYQTKLSGEQASGALAPLLVAQKPLPTRRYQALASMTAKTMPSLLRHGQVNPALQDATEKPSIIDPALLNILVTQLILKASTHSINTLSQQFDRATQVQEIVRDRQVRDYQQQIAKSVEQMDRAHSAMIITALSDWIISAAEAAYGVVKCLELDPVDVADGLAYLTAGVAGLVKAGAETAMIMGADSASCENVINNASKVQFSMELVATALDIVQIGRGVIRARVIVSETEKALVSEAGSELTHVAASGIESGIETGTQQLGEEVSNMLRQYFTSPLEVEMVETENMATEAAQRQLANELAMVKKIGKSFTADGIKKLVSDSAREAIKELAVEGENLAEDKLRQTIINKLKRKITTTVQKECTSATLLLLRRSLAPINSINHAYITIVSAELFKEIQQLIVQQQFCADLSQHEADRKKTEQQQLKEAYQNAGAALSSAVEQIDNYGNAVARIATARA